MPEETREQLGTKLVNKFEDMYHEFLKTKLDLIFNGGLGDDKENLLRHTSKNIKCYEKEPIGKIKQRRLIKKLKSQQQFCDFGLCDEISNYYYDGYTVIWRLNIANLSNREYNIVDKEGNVQLRNWSRIEPKFKKRHVYIETLKGTEVYTGCDFENPKFYPYQLKNEFSEGYAIASIGRYINIIDEDGNFILKEFIFDPNYQMTFGDFHEGLVRVKTSDHEIDYMDTEGNLMFGAWKTIKDKDSSEDEQVLEWSGESDISIGYDFHEGYAKVETNLKYNLIDHNGKLLFPEENLFLSDIEHGIVKTGLSEDKTHYLHLKGVIIKELHKGYHITDKYGEYQIRFQPVYQFNAKFILCFHNYEYYIYDRFLDKYIALGNADNITFQDNLIYNANDNKVLLVYSDRVIDITFYYNKHLKDKETINITPGIKGLLTEDEFYLHNIKEIEAEMALAKTDYIVTKQEIDTKHEERKVDEVKKQYEESETQRQEELKSTLEQIKELREKLGELREEKGPQERRPITKEFFIKVDDHLEINQYYLEKGLKFFDLSLLTFNNVKMSNIDFSHSNINYFDPQKAYNKDLSGSNFEHVYIDPLVSFSGVDITGCRFSKDNDSKTLDILPNFEGAIYDDTTTYNGIPLRIILSGMQEDYEPEIPRLKF